MGWTSTPMAGGGRGAGADHVSANTLPTNLIMMKVCLDGEIGDSDCWPSYEFPIFHSSGCSSAGLSSSHPHTPTAKNKGGQVRYLSRDQDIAFCLVGSRTQEIAFCSAGSKEIISCFASQDGSHPIPGQGGPSSSTCLSLIPSRKGNSALILYHIA